LTKLAVAVPQPFKVGPQEIHKFAKHHSYLNQQRPAIGYILAHSTLEFQPAGQRTLLPNAVRRPSSNSTVVDPSPAAVEGELLHHAIG
jgi:hypothetical protein